MCDQGVPRILKVERNAMPIRSWSPISLLLPVLLQAQVLDGTLRDSLSGAAIEGAHVRAVRSGSGVVSGPDGAFSLLVDAPDSLLITHVGYHELRVPVKNDGALTLSLRPRVQELRPVEVGPPAPEVVFRDEELHVADHLVNDEGTWVLAYTKRRMLTRQELAGAGGFKGAELVLLDTLQRRIASASLNEEVVAMHRSYRNEVVLETRARAFVANYEDGGILLAALDKAFLHERLLPWTDSIPHRLLGNDHHPALPAFSHFVFDAEQQRTDVFCAVEDAHYLSIYRSQYKYLSNRDKVDVMNIANDLGVDKELVAGALSGIAGDMRFKAPYAPLFVQDDGVYVFDHAAERIRSFGAGLQEREGVPMRHQRDRRWAERLLQDRATGRVHAVYRFRDQVLLAEVDPLTGRVGQPFRLMHPWPEGVQVHDGHVYYVYRPKGSLEHRALYRERLPVSGNDVPLGEVEPHELSGTP